MSWVNYNTFQICFFVHIITVGLMPKRSGRLSTLLDTLWLKASGHSHPRDSSCVAVERAVSTMRETLARVIGRMWKATDADDNPEDIFQPTRREEFLALRVDSLEIYVFATDKNLDVLADQKHWFCDGTFDIAPKITSSIVYT